MHSTGSFEAYVTAIVRDTGMPRQDVYSMLSKRPRIFARPRRKKAKAPVHVPMDFIRLERGDLVRLRGNGQILSVLEPVTKDGFVYCAEKDKSKTHFFRFDKLTILSHTTKEPVSAADFSREMTQALL